MKRMFLFLLCFSVWPVFAQNATPFCTSMTTRVHIQTHIGNPKYISSYSKSEFLKKEGRRFDPYTMGLTVAEMTMKTKATPSLEQNAGKICVGIADLDIELDYPNLTVYIDKKYAPSSCEYRVIKDHENYHVMVAQQALPFFRQDVEKVVSKTLKKMSPKIVYSPQEIQPAIDDLTNSVLTAVQPVLKHINAKLIEKNEAIDTPEMYKQTTALCHHW